MKASSCVRCKIDLASRLVFAELRPTLRTSDAVTSLEPPVVHEHYEPHASRRRELRTITADEEFENGFDAEQEAHARDLHRLVLTAAE